MANYSLPDRGLRLRYRCWLGIHDDFLDIQRKTVSALPFGRAKDALLKDVGINLPIISGWPGHRGGIDEIQKLRGGGLASVEIKGSALSPESNIVSYKARCLAQRSRIPDVGRIGFHQAAAFEVPQSLPQHRQTHVQCLIELFRGRRGVACKCLEQQQGKSVWLDS